MLGRAAYHDPGVLAPSTGACSGGGAGRGSLDGGGALPALCPGAACARRGAAGDDPADAGLFHGRPGARTWRRILTVEGVRPGAGAEVIENALRAVSPRVVEPV